MKTVARTHNKSTHITRTLTVHFAEDKSIDIDLSISKDGFSHESHFNLLPWEAKSLMFNLQDHFNS